MPENDDLQVHELEHDDHAPHVCGLFVSALETKDDEGFSF